MPHTNYRPKSWSLSPLCSHTSHSKTWKPFGIIWNPPLPPPPHPPSPIIAETSPFRAVGAVEYPHPIINFKRWCAALIFVCTLHFSFNMREKKKTGLISKARASHGLVFLTWKSSMVSPTHAPMLLHMLVAVVFTRSATFFLQLASHSSESPKKQLFLLLSPLPFFAKNNSSAWFISGFYYLLWFFLSVLLTLYSILPSHSLCCQPKGKQVKREGRRCITIAFTQDGPKGTFFISVIDRIWDQSSETCHSNHERRFLKLYRRWLYKSSSLKGRFAQKRRGRGFCHLFVTLDGGTTSTPLPP